MSLHHLAKHIQSQGRGEDKMLVHMTPKEVHGLQALAMASGGSLTVNPQTGLPEAGWLSKLLPMLAGAALNVFVPGLGALGSAALVGTASAAASGSLKQGLMAGLGAYGGAGITSSLAASGGAAAANAGNAANAGALADAAAKTAIDPVLGAGQNIGGALAQGAAVPTAATAPGQLTAAGLTGSPPVASAPTSAIGQAEQARQAAMAKSVIAPPSAAPVGDGTFMGDASARFDQVKAGYDKAAAMKDPLKTFALKNPVYTAAAAAPLFQSEPQKKPRDKGMIRQYTFDRTPIGDQSDVPFNSTAERDYFADNWVAHEPYKASMKNPPDIYGAATGGIVALATGGEPVKSIDGIDRSVKTTSSGGMNPLDPRDIAEKATSARAAQAAKDKYKIPVYSFDPRTQQYTLLQADGDDPTSSPTSATAATTPAAPTPATAVQVANMYNQAYRRPPTRAELDAAMAGGMDTAGLKSQLTGSDEYLNNLTKPFVPRLSYDASGRGSVEGALKPYQSPEEQLGLTDFYGKMNSGLDAQMERALGMAYGGMADGGSPEDEYEGHLGGYSDGGRLLKGPGDGVSDSIPAVIGNRQPARLADGEFVVPARIVSELGNGSTEAGARKLYAMMSRVQKSRSKSVGKDKVAVDSKSDKHLPA